jgi:hypothetical protein
LKSSASIAIVAASAAGTAAAPASPPLLQTALRHRDTVPRRREFYGWALLSQLPGAGHVGLVDPHERFPDMPAWYESPLELADRQEYMARRSVATRALAIVTQRDDFDVVDGEIRLNRYRARATWRRACGAAPFAR